MGDFVKNIYKIDSNDRTPEIWAPYDSIKKAFKVSPTLKQYPELLQCIEQSPWVSGNISENPIDKSVKTVTIKYQDTTKDGGPGSGNHGHKGRPGQKGGSEHSLGPKEKAKIEKRLVGQRTHDGVEIRSVSAHAFDRIGGRKMSVGRIDKMRTDGVPSPGNRPHTRCYDIEGSRMVVDTESGNVMTVMWRGGRKK